MSATVRPAARRRREGALPFLLLALAACAGVGRGPASSGPATPAPVIALTVPPGDRSRVPLPTSAPALRLPQQRHFALSNGLKVRLVEVHKLPILSLYLVVDAGAIHDPAEAPGLASLTAAMMTEGTARRSAIQISDDLGAIGATLQAGAGFDSASLSGSVLSAHLDELLALFADVLVEPSFPPGDFARVQDQRLVTLLEQRDQPGVVAAKAFQKLYWGDHPYGHWPMGTGASLRALRREDLVRFHALRWRPRGSELVVVGDVSFEALLAKLEKALAGWTGAVPPTPAAVEKRAPGQRALLIPKSGPAPQAFVLMGMPGFARSSKDFVPGEVALQILGGGSASRLFRELREKQGYTYGIYARAEARRLGGTSLIVGSVRTEVAGAATRALLEQIALLRREKVPEEELTVARHALLLSLPAEFATTLGIAGKLGEEVVYGLPDGYWDEYAAEVARVSAEDVERVAKAYLDPDALTTVMVCDPAAVRPQLEGLPLGDIEVARGSEPEDTAQAPSPPGQVAGGSSGGRGGG